MNRTKIFLSSVVLIGATLVGCTKEEKIPYSEIPDMIFRDYLLVHFDTNMDGFISKEEAKAVKEIDLSNTGGAIKSLDGIQYFTSLEILILGYTTIESLDLSNFSRLEILDCSNNNYLEALILPDSKRLKSLNCSNTRLESVNLIGFEFLEDFTYNEDYRIGILNLNISNSSVKRIQCNKLIRNLNLSNLPDLEVLSIINSFLIFETGGNHTVDLSKSTKLKSLTCEYILSEINISQCTALEALILKNVGNKTVDLSNKTALKYLVLSFLENIDLDISNNRALEILDFQCYNSKVSSFKNNTELKTLVLALKEGETLDLSNNTLLENLYVIGNGDVNISNCKNLIDLTFLMNNIIETINIQQYNALKNVTILSCNNLASINMSGSQNLDSLRISTINTGLDVDISNCKNLRSLILDVENLNKLNASGCTTLKRFEYQPNYYNPTNWNLINLNMSNCTSLVLISCNYNKINELDVSGCTALTTLSCTNNNLKELDLYTCLALRELNCFNNNDLKTLILNKNHQITTLNKDSHTEIILKD